MKRIALFLFPLLFLFGGYLFSTPVVNLADDPAMKELIELEAKAEQGDRIALKQLFHKQWDEFTFAGYQGAITEVMKKVPELFFSVLEGEDLHTRESILQDITNNWWYGSGKDAGLEEIPLKVLLQPVEQLIAREKKKDTKRFLRWCRDYMKDLAKKGFED